MLKVQYVLERKGLLQSVCKFPVVLIMILRVEAVDSELLDINLWDLILLDGY